MTTTIFSILAGLAILIFISVRQMRWQRVTTAAMMKMPVILAIIGMVTAAQTFDAPGALRFGTGDVALIAAEVAVAVLGGWLMGRMTQIATIDGSTRSRLTAVGLLVWFGFLAIRIGGEVLAHVDHLPLASSAPLVLFMIAIVKAAQAVTVRERVNRHEAGVAQAGQRQMYHV
ncbi:MAG TPA: hypothetical protein VIP98_05755 [Microlunatus sp.]